MSKREELCECGFIKDSSNEITSGHCAARICDKKLSRIPSRKEFNDLENKVIKLENLLNNKIKP